MLYFEEIDLQLYSYAEKICELPQRGRHPALVTPVTVIPIWQGSKGQVNGLLVNGLAQHRTEGLFTLHSFKI